MKAMILAAGEGTRLRPLTFCRPKAMMPILNTPIIEHSVLWMREQGIKNFMVNLHHLGEQIEHHLGDGERFGVQISYSKEKELLGTAGGVKNVASFFDEDEFFVVGGDDLIEIDLQAMLRFHRKIGALATISVTKRTDVEHFGVVQTKEDGRILRFIEKPKNWTGGAALVNTGVYLFNQEVLELIPCGFYDFGSQLFPKLAEQGAPIYVFEHGGYWCDIGSIESYFEANWAALEGKVKVQHLSQQPVTFSTSHQDSWAAGNQAVIEPNVVLIKSILGENCVVGKRAYVKDSILWSNVKVDVGAQLVGCIVTDGCHVSGKLEKALIVSKR